VANLSYNQSAHNVMESSWLNQKEDYSLMQVWN
jgi:hypothetical protein